MQLWIISQEHYLKRKGITPKKIAAINQNYAWGQDYGQTLKDL